MILAAVRKLGIFPMIEYCCFRNVFHVCKSTSDWHLTELDFHVCFGVLCRHLFDTSLAIRIAESMEKHKSTVLSNFHQNTKSEPKGEQVIKGMLETAVVRPRMRLPIWDQIENVTDWAASRAPNFNRLPT